MPIFKITTLDSQESFDTLIALVTKAAAADEAQRALVDMMWDAPSDSPYLKFEAVISDETGAQIYRASLDFRSTWLNPNKLKQ